MNRAALLLRIMSLPTRLDYNQTTRTTSTEYLDGASTELTGYQDDNTSYRRPITPSKLSIKRVPIFT